MKLGGTVENAMVLNKHHKQRGLGLGYSQFSLALVIVLQQNHLMKFYFVFQVKHKLEENITDK